MRDLQKDLDRIRMLFADESNSQDVEEEYIGLVMDNHEEWLQRAIKAESLNKELVEALDEALWTLECYTSQDVDGLITVLAKAKELIQGS